MKAKYVKDSRSVMTELIMPNDANPLNTLMGGNLLRAMDVIGGICAAKHCEAHVVTASVDHVSFTTPIQVGEVITLEASITRAFNTSVEVVVDVFATSIKGKNRRKSNHAYFTFVAISDEEKKPIKVPQLKPKTKAELDRYDSAPQRREMRLVLSGRIDLKDAKGIKSVFVK